MTVYYSPSSFLYCYFIDTLVEIPWSFICLQMSNMSWFAINYDLFDITTAQLPLYVRFYDCSCIDHTNVIILCQLLATAFFSAFIRLS